MLRPVEAQGESARSSSGTNSTVSAQFCKCCRFRPENEVSSQGANALPHSLFFSLSYSDLLPSGRVSVSPHLQSKWEAKCRGCETHVINEVPGDDGISPIKPEISPNRAVTEGNNLIGSILITQKRSKSVLCHAEESACDSSCNKTLNQLGPLYQR